MTYHVGDGMDALIDQARRGDGSDLGPLLDRYRDRLRMSAHARFGGALRSKIDASDLVQETFLRAIRDFPNFQGRDERELMSWLWKIMANCFADQIKHHKRQIRSRSREESLDLIFENAPASTRKLLAARGPSPSEAALRREQAALLADAVARLPPDYREVYLLRTLHHLPFDVIALRMRRKVGAVRMLWVRAIESLSSMLEGRTCL